MQVGTIDSVVRDTSTVGSVRRWVYYVVAFLIPLVGFVLYFVYRNKDRGMALTIARVAAISQAINMLLLFMLR